MYPRLRSADPYGLLRELYAVDRAEYDDGDPPENRRERRVFKIEVREINPSGKITVLETTKPRLKTYREGRALLRAKKLSSSLPKPSKPGNRIKVVGLFLEDKKFFDITKFKY